MTWLWTSPRIPGTIVAERATVPIPPRRTDMTSELEALRIEVAQLRQSIGELQERGRKPWSARRAVAACFALVFALFLVRLPGNEALATAQDEKPKGQAKELVCSSLRVVGPGGKNLLTLGSDPDGGKLQ